MLAAAFVLAQATSPACTPAPAGAGIPIKYADTPQRAYARYLFDVPVKIGARGTPVDVGMDTGSVGLVVSVGTFYRMMGFRPPPTPRTAPITRFPSPLPPGVVGPGPTGHITYTSDGLVEMGNWWTVPLTFGRPASATTVPTRILVVTQYGCDQRYRKVGRCGVPRPAYFGSNMGVGFADLFNAIGPEANPFLRLRAMADGSMPRRYILTNQGLTLGGTASDLAGFRWINLTKSATIPGDWNLPPACLRFPGYSSTAHVCGQFKVDTGLYEMILNMPQSQQIPELRGYVAQEKALELLAPGLDAPQVVDWRFNAPGNSRPTYPAAIPSNISVVTSASASATPFFNTGQHILYEYDYAYDADCGAVGFRPAQTPP